MKKVFIKYNPYKLETEMTIDGQELAENSELRRRIFPGDTEESARFQDWVEELPKLLKAESNDKDFEITFHGTMLDYNDLVAVMTEAAENGELAATIDRIPAKETTDKEKLIDEVVAKITSEDCPFDPIQVQDLKRRFEDAKNDEFKVCIIATMSAGKSTLINAMLETQIMPSASGACTATITYIKDDPTRTSFHAEYYDKDGKAIKFYDDDGKQIELYYYRNDRARENGVKTPILLVDKDGTRLPIHNAPSLKAMELLNKAEQVPEIRMEGKIPFVTSDDISLVLVDTPGPNSARNRDHQKMQKEFLESSDNTLILYLMTGQVGTNDDEATLNSVLETISASIADKKKGKQARDRFLFVINKLDERDPESDGLLDDEDGTLNHVREYLDEFGIKNPNLFPVAALPALNIRLQKSGKKLSETAERSLSTQIETLNAEEYHFEKYASLPLSIHKEIDKKLEKAQAEWNGELKENPETALIHSGIVSVEAAIRQYVQKYAKTAKIRSLVATFKEKLAEWAYIEETKKALDAAKDAHKEILAQIKAIKASINDGKEATKFKASVAKTISELKNGFSESIWKIVGEYQKEVNKRLEEPDKELTLSEANYEAVNIEKFAQQLDIKFESELNKLIREKLIDTHHELLRQYTERLKSLAEELNLDSGQSIKIDPLEVVKGNLTQVVDIQKRAIDKKVEDGEEWVENTDKKWYKPWTWFQEKGYWRTKYTTVKRINKKQLLGDILGPAEGALRGNGTKAINHAIEQSESIGKEFENLFDRLNAEISKKMDELALVVGDKEIAEKEIAATKKKLRWLEKIQRQVESILEI